MNERDSSAPVVGRLAPSPVGGRRLRAVGVRVRDRVRQNLLGEAGGIIVHDGHGTERETVIADLRAISTSVRRVPLDEDAQSPRATHAVPVPVDMSPPSVIGARRRWECIGVVSVRETEVKNGPHDGVPLRLSPRVVHPVVRDRERGRELGEVEEVLRVPVVAFDAEILACRRVSCGGLCRRRTQERRN